MPRSFEQYAAQRLVQDRDRITLDSEIASALYRVAQEALNNVLKHAGASSVSLILERGERFLRLIMEDDGCGFDTEEVLASPATARRLGVRGMRERVARLGGTLEIESSPGNGTTLFARIPASSSAKAEEEISGQ